MRKTMMLMIVFLASSLAGDVNAQQSETTTNCPVDTTTDKDTGNPRNGVKVCSEDDSGSIGFSISQEEVDHFLKYPTGQSA
jgi:hypothetical protein